MPDGSRKRQYGWKRCFEENRKLPLWKRFFACAPSVLDYRWRMRDFRFHRSHGGLAERLLRLDGHSPVAFVLPAALLLFLIYGPTLGWRGIGALALYLLSLIVSYLAARWAGDKHLMEVQLLVLTLVAAIVWFWPGARESLEWGHGIYRHALVPFFLVLVGVLLLVAKALSRGIFKGMRAGPGFASFLPHANLFVPPPQAPEITGGSILRSIVRVPLENPLPLLFFPSLVLLFLPYYLPLDWWALGLLLANWLLLSFPGFHGRFDSMLPLVRRAFFIGGQLVVSLVIIVLAAGRVAEISYIQTVVESSSWHTMLSYIFAAYFLFWFTEYWLNRRLLEELIGLLQRSGDPIGQATYDIDPQEPFAQGTKIALVGRKVQIHGGGRLISIGDLVDSAEAFELYEKKDLFGRLIETASWSQLIGSTARRSKTRQELKKLKRRVDFYFGFVNLMLFALATILGLVLSRMPQQPIAIVTTSPEPAAAQEPPGVDLAQLIWNDETGEDVVLLAASGGGTRAALYTESVLRGLHSIDALDRVVLASGVSGGGAALAYYSSRIADLQNDSDGGVWDQFRCDMSRPFIWDVLEGVSEWRIVAGTRSGELLAESLCRAFFEECPKLDGTMAGPSPPKREGRQTLGEVDTLGLILNTSLAGHLECEDCAKEADFATEVNRKDRLDRTNGSVAGGRLIFTNLDNPEVFPLEKSSTDLQYVVVRDPRVLLPVGAALNANFPPVFSNAPVDRDRTDRYWVTDGGATDNRGLISLLYALRGALEDMPEERASLPDIHIVMAEASAGSTGYSQDRGIGTKFGAPGKIASGLIGELLDEVRLLYASAGGTIHFHDLAMPEFMRIDGGLGTHWMLPRYVKLTNPDPGVDETLPLDSFALRQVIEDLHQPLPSTEVGLCEGEKEGWGIRRTRHNLPAVQEWAEDPESQHQEVWQGLVSELDSGSSAARRHR